MKKITLLFPMLLFCVSFSFGQFTGGLRFTSNTTSLLTDYGDNTYSISSSGLGPFFNIESKRLIVQGSYVRYFNTHLGEFNTLDADASFLLKPYLLDLVFGYKINTKKPVKFYPMLGINKYTLGIQYDYTEIDDNTVTLRDQLNLYGVSLGFGTYYTYGNIVFDLQTKFSVMGGNYADETVLAPGLSFAFGIGYKFSKEEKGSLSAD
jgi:hypothetical protein